MRDDADFTAYVEARWPTLVRALVLLGDSREQAVAVAERGLAGCYLGWRRIRGADDMDVEVYAEVLAARGRAGATRRASGVTGVPVAAPVVGSAPPDAALLLESLLDALASLGEDERTAVVLQHGAGLTALQVADVLEVDVVEVEERVVSAVKKLDVEGLQRCR